MVRVRMYQTTGVAQEKFLEYCERNADDIKTTRFNGRGNRSGVSVVVLKNNDFVLFMSCKVYVVWCIGRTYYDDLYQCYRRSGFKISKELAEEFDRC